MLIRRFGQTLHAAITHRATPMRPTTLLAALLVTALPCLEATAGWCCSKRCSAPSYQTRYEATTSYAQYCWCCETDHWRSCSNGNPCPNSDEMCITLSPNPPSGACSFGVRMSSEPRRASCGQPKFYPMVCDACTHRLRFPHCGEVATEFYTLAWLGQPCASSCGGCR